MNQLQKSLTAVDILLEEMGREYIDKVFNEVLLLDIEGPTLEMYFENFSEGFRNVHTPKRYSFDEPCIFHYWNFKHWEDDLVHSSYWRSIPENKKETTDIQSVVSFLFLPDGRFKCKIQAAQLRNH